MRIFNAKKSTLTIPLVGSNQKLTISPKSPSGDFMPNKELLSLLITSFDYDEIAIIVSGPYEISMCSQVSGCVGFVVNSLEEAIERFSTETYPAENTANLKSPVEKKEEEPAPVQSEISAESVETNESVEIGPMVSDTTTDTVTAEGNSTKKTIVRRYRKHKED